MVNGKHLPARSQYPKVQYNGLPFTHSLTVLPKDTVTDWDWAGFEPSTFLSVRKRYNIYYYYFIILIVIFWYCDRLSAGKRSPSSTPSRCPRRCCNGRLKPSELRSRRKNLMLVDFHPAYTRLTHWFDAFWAELTWQILPILIDCYLVLLPPNSLR